MTTNNPTHWSAIAEKGTGLGLRILSGFYSLFGRRACLILVVPITTFFYIIDRAGKRNSAQYLTRIFALKGSSPPTFWTGLQHYINFASKILDSFIAWTHPNRTGHFAVHSQASLDQIASRGAGVMLIVSHMGNVEMCRATLAIRFKRQVTVLVHTRHAETYNNLIKSVRPDAESNVMQVTEVGPETAIALQERIERGEWIAIAGDRTPVTGQSRVSNVPFLGKSAPFSQGPYILAALMGCPVYLLFCIRSNDGHDVYFEQFSDAITLPRKDKDAALSALAARYAQRLEHYCLMAPLQWYNFFDFWAAPAASPEVAAGKLSVAAPPKQT